LRQLPRFFRFSAVGGQPTECGYYLGRAPGIMQFAVKDQTALIKSFCLLIIFFKGKIAGAAQSECVFAPRIQSAYFRVIQKQ